MPRGRQLGVLRWRHAIKHPPAWVTTICNWVRRRAVSRDCDGIAPFLGIRPVVKFENRWSLLLLIQKETPEGKMLTPEEQALITAMNDRLVKLYVESAEAKKGGDRDRARELQTEIERVADHCQDIQHTGEE